MVTIFNLTGMTSVPGPPEHILGSIRHMSSSCSLDLSGHTKGSSNWWRNLGLGLIQMHDWSSQETRSVRQSRMGFYSPPRGTRGSDSSPAILLLTRFNYI